MPNKLPAYFEKYMDNKFGEVWTRFDQIDKRIEDLKKHVNDEVQELKNRVYKIERWFWWLAIMLMIFTAMYSEDSRSLIISYVRGIIGL